MITEVNLSVFVYRLFREDSFQSTGPRDRDRACTYVCVVWRGIVLGGKRHRGQLSRGQLFRGQLTRGELTRGGGIAQGGIAQGGIAHGGN